ncbi:MAG: hypothetical protein WBX15_00115, partial [Thermoanaerobaculia bacterium]
MTDVLGRYGYLALFVGVFLENVGIPVPGETVLLARIAHTISAAEPDSGLSVALSPASAPQHSHHYAFVAE